MMVSLTNPSAECGGRDVRNAARLTPSRWIDACMFSVSLNRLKCLTALTTGVKVYKYFICFQINF